MSARRRALAMMISATVAGVAVGGPGAFVEVEGCRYLTALFAFLALKRRRGHVVGIAVVVGLATIAIFSSPRAHLMSA